jgi:hypothetical protein
MDRFEFEKRMDNWRRVVRGSIGSGGGGYCAGWARLYVADRVKAEAAAARLSIVLGAVVVHGPGRDAVDELDGWLVEAAVRSLADFNERRILQFWYVYQWPEPWIKTKLMLRRSGIALIKGRAEANLQNVFTRLENAATILSNNLYAGKFPRPESTDAHVGATLTLEKDETLVE